MCSICGELLTKQKLLCDRCSDKLSLIHEICVNRDDYCIMCDSLIDGPYYEKCKLCKTCYEMMENERYKEIDYRMILCHICLFYHDNGKNCDNNLYNIQHKFSYHNINSCNLCNYGDNIASSLRLGTQYWNNKYDDYYYNDFSIHYCNIPIKNKYNNVNVL